MKNNDSLDTLCAALAYALGIEAPKYAAPANKTLCGYIDEVFGGEKADRLFMYNPDVVAEWLYEKYPELFSAAKSRIDLELPLATVMPSVTPVCFATMYTGAQPEVHGICKYEKPVLKTDTLFDALVRAGKRVALISTYTVCSVSKIFLEREIDYFFFDDSYLEGANAKAAELIMSDEYDVIVLYNGNYDDVMHKNGPESARSLSELRLNAHAFGTICEMIKTHWKSHNTLVGFAMDHGCHEIDGNSGSHGLDMDEDINIVHLYKGYKRVEK